MAKEAIVANLPFSQEQRTGLGVYVGNLMRANREYPVVDRVSIYKEGGGLIALTHLNDLHSLRKLEGIFQAELKGYRSSGESNVAFDLSDALTDEDSGVGITSEPILEIPLK